MGGIKNEANDNNSSSSQNYSGTQLTPYGMPWSQPIQQPKSSTESICNATSAGVDSLAKAGGTIVSSVFDYQKVAKAHETQLQANKTKIKLSEEETKRLEKAFDFQKNENAEERKKYEAEAKSKWDAINKCFDNLHLEVDKTLDQQGKSMKNQKKAYKQHRKLEEKRLKKWEKIATKCAEKGLIGPPMPEVAQFHFEHSKPPKQTTLLDLGQALSSQQSSSNNKHRFYKQPIPAINEKKKSEPLMIDGYEIQDEGTTVTSDVNI